MKRLLPLACILAILGCDGESTTSDGSALTYYKDTKPILDARCANCHVPGGIAPFALVTFADVQEHAGAVKAAVADRTMPPWMPADGCNDYVNDRSLTEEQIDVIVRWVDGGAAEGDPADEGAPLDVGDSRALSRVDLEVGMPDAYTMVETPDEYRCFVLDWPESDTTYVTGMGVEPGNAAVVHHVIAFLAPPSRVDDVLALDAADDAPGYQCFGGPGFAGNEWVGAWVPGNTGYDYPDGTGIRVEPGSKIVMQMHYNSLTAGPQPDLTKIRLKTDPSVSNVAKIQPWANPQWLASDAMTIPAATSDVGHSFEQDPTLLTGGEAILIHAPALHMHELGKTARLSVQRAGGGESCLLEIPAWDFHWQGTYPMREPVRLEPGDKLRVECTWDNPTMKDVTWGEGTGDEMCLGTFYYTLAD